MWHFFLPSPQCGISKSSSSLRFVLENNKNIGVEKKNISGRKKVLSENIRTGCCWNTENHDEGSDALC